MEYFMETFMLLALAYSPPLILTGLLICGMIFPKYKVVKPSIAAWLLCLSFWATTFLSINEIKYAEVVAIVGIIAHYIYCRCVRSEGQQVSIKYRIWLCIYYLISGALFVTYNATGQLSILETIGRLIGYEYSP